MELLEGKYRTARENWLREMLPILCKQVINTSPRMRPVACDRITVRYSPRLNWVYGYIAYGVNEHDMIVIGSTCQTLLLAGDTLLHELIHASVRQDDKVHGRRFRGAALHLGYKDGMGRTMGKALTKIIVACAEQACAKLNRTNAICKKMGICPFCDPEAVGCDTPPYRAIGYRHNREQAIAACVRIYAALARPVRGPLSLDSFPDLTHMATPLYPEYVIRLYQQTPFTITLDRLRHSTISTSDVPAHVTHAQYNNR